MKHIFYILSSLVLGISISRPLLAQWTNTNLPFNGDAVSFAVSRTSIYVGTTGGGVFRSTDNGLSWTGVNTGLTGNWVIALSFTEANLFAGTYWHSVFRSTNDGFSWAGVGSGQTYSDVYALAVIPNDAVDTNLFAATADSLGRWYGVFLSTNNGDTWIDVTNELTTSCITPNCWVDAFAVSGANLFAGTVGRGVFLSTNNGSNWTAVNTGLTNKYARVLAVNGANLYAGTWGDSGGVFLSTNNGTAWIEISNGLSNRHIRALTVNGTNLFAGTEGNGVFLSTNNGTSWAEVNTGLRSTWATALAVSGAYLFVGTTRFDTLSGGVWRRPLSEMVTSVGTPLSELPVGFSLDQNYPNPFNPSTTISFSIPLKSFVSLELFNVLGMAMSTLISEELPAGRYSRQWNAARLPSGVYFYRLMAYSTVSGFTGSFNETKKFLLLR